MNNDTIKPDPTPQPENALDMFRDEFQRIAAICYGKDEPVWQEVLGLCERAMTGIESRVPLIKQIERTEADLTAARSELASVKAELKEMTETKDYANDMLVDAHGKIVSIQAELARLESEHYFALPEADVGFPGITWKQEAEQAQTQLSASAVKVEEMRIAIPKLRDLSAAASQAEGHENWPKAKKIWAEFDAVFEQALTPSPAKPEAGVRENIMKFRAWLTFTGTPIPDGETLKNGFYDTMLQNMWYAWTAGQSTEKEGSR